MGEIVRLPVKKKLLWSLKTTGKNLIIKHIVVLNIIIKVSIKV